jgi:hypothetical protein
MCRCSYPEGMVIKPDSINELDPCLYETTNIFTNCIVEISKCVRCGNISVTWKRTDRTIEVPDCEFDEYV